MLFRSFFSKRFPPSFRISQSLGDGIVSHGTHEWTDYALDADIMIHLAVHGGVALRVQGLRRYYSLRITKDGQLQIVRVRDEKEVILASKPFDFVLEKAIPVSARVVGSTISAVVGGVAIEATDDSAEAFKDGGIGLTVYEGALSTDAVKISAA